MKSIKYLVLIFSTLVLTSSCGSDDDDPVNTDTIVGKWQVNRRINKGAEETLSDCFKTTTLEFTADNKFTSILKDSNANTNNVCETVLTRNASWKKANDSTYSLTFIGGPSDGITAENTYLFEDNNAICNDNKILKIKTYYTRVK